MLYSLLIALPLCLGMTVWLVKRHNLKKTNDTILLKSDYSLTPENTIITFDIHGVLFNPDYLNIALTFLKKPRNYTLLPYLFNPWLLNDIRKLYSQNAVAEKYLIYLTHKYPYLKPYMRLAIQLGNTQKPVQAMITLINTLKKKGYTLHILSNIGERFFYDLQKKHPAIFALFDASKVTSSSENYIGKPHHQIFHRYLETYNHNNKNIVFIDDKQKNVLAARSLGIIGYLHRSPQQLSKDLATLLND